MEQSDSSDDLVLLIDRYLSGTLTQVELAELEKRLLESEAAQNLMLQMADIHASLHVEASLWHKDATENPALNVVGSNQIQPGQTIPGSPILGSPKPVFTLRFRQLISGMGLVAAMVLVALMLFQSERQPKDQTPDASNVITEVAVIKEITKARWPRDYQLMAVGDVLSRNQRIQLKSGLVALEFAGGTLMTLKGETDLTLTSSRSARMTLGKAEIYVPAPEPSGFTVNTPISTIVDRGTAFNVSIDPANGDELVEVTEGKVEVTTDGWPKPRMMASGQFLSIDSKSRLLTQYELGDGTSNFRFPTIEPPSNQDYADMKQGHATISLLQGEISRRAKEQDVSRLLSHSDLHRRNLAIHFDHLKPQAELLVDLGSIIPIRKINCYTYFQRSLKYEGVRTSFAGVRFQIFGYIGKQPPTTFDLSNASEWIRIVDMKEGARLDRGDDQRAVSIMSPVGEIGRYRYLLWKITGRSRYVEFDVYKGSD